MGEDLRHVRSLSLKVQGVVDHNDRIILFPAGPTVVVQVPPVGQPQALVNPAVVPRGLEVDQIHFQGLGVLAPGLVVGPTVKHHDLEPVGVDPIQGTILHRDCEIPQAELVSQNNRHCGMQEVAGADNGGMQEVAGMDTNLSVKCIAKIICPQPFL